jgi:hypothetical protein
LVFFISLGLQSCKTGFWTPEKCRRLSLSNGWQLGFIDASENYHIFYNNARRWLNVWVPSGSIDPVTFICQVHTCCYVSHTRQRKLPDCVRLEMTCYSMPSADRKNVLLTVTITCPSHNKTNICTEVNFILLNILS